MGIGRQTAVETNIVASTHVVLGLAEGYEAVGLQTQQTERCKVVVEHEGVHVLGREPGPGPQVASRMDGLSYGEVRPINDALVLWT